MKINYIKKIPIYLSTSMKVFSRSLRSLLFSNHSRVLTVVSGNQYGEIPIERILETVIKPQCI